MRLLLDTQLWLWAAIAPDRLSTEARDLFGDAKADLIWSVVTIWEVAIKRGMRRAEFDVEPDAFMRFLRRGPFEELDIRAEHTLPVARLVPLHKDPFDRLLIAQAMVENVTLVTADRVIAAYPGPIRPV